VQDPNQANNWNAVGRWHYGPWFWPVFPALYNLPEGTYSPAGYENTVTTTPEGWHDTPVINGVAYPTLEVDPTTYRFRLLNATNDRMLTFNLFEAKSTATLADGTLVSATQPDAGGIEQPVLTEIDMVPAGAPLASNACAPGERRPTALDAAGTTFCTPETWPTDGRIGGVPNPAGVGPTIYQVANESGWLPKVASYEPTPINYIQDKGRIVVLNVDLGNSGLLIAPAERADVVIDFSQYAGKTLLVYNDSGAPVPAGDPRNDLFTGVGDQTGQGGTEDTKPGYGPNTRTMMQIKVKAVATGPVSPVLDPVALNTSISNAYFSDPARRPVVAQDVYSGFDASWAGMKPADMYGDIYLGSLKNPTFKFTPGTPSDGVASVAVATQGSGYVVTPDVVIAKPAAAGGVAATAVASMKVEKLNITNVGKGYTAAPLMSFSGGGGNGLMANAFLRVDTTSGSVTAPGAGYNPPSGRLVINFTPAPGATINNPTPGVTPTGYATVTLGKVTGITILTAGSGYTAIPLITVTNKDYSSKVAGPGTGAKATVTGLVDSIVLYGTDNTTPAMNALTSGGGGYTNLTPGVFNVNMRGGLPIDPATGLAKAGTVNAVATASGKVYDITLTHPGTGYAAGEVPGVTLTQKINGVLTAPATVATATATAAATAGAKASYLVKTKTIQELFDPTYGRLNATLGIELPFTSALTQTTIPLGYVDETTEKFADGETQIWKITHNGVDSHPVHFHLLDVQVINRVGWDGFIQPIEPKEMGWKETVMMSPLEDIIVAVRAKKPVLAGFGVPLSERLMDPTQPLGSPFGFTQIDAATGNPAVVTNALVNFGWEYVWHCHILGHEENDFMRPIQFAANEQMPANFAPTLAVPTVAGNTATLSFVDNSTTEYKFSVRRADVALNGTVGAYVEVGTQLANGNGYVDATLAANQMYSYEVAAVGGYAEAVSAPQQASTYVAPTAATNVVATANLATQVAVTWTAGAPVTSYSIVRTGGLGAAVTFTANAAATSYTDNTAVGETAYSYVVTAINGDKQTASAPATVTTPPAVLAAPTGLSGTLTAATSATLSWTDTTKVETGFAIWRSTNGAPAVQIATTPARTNQQKLATGGNVTYVNTGLTSGATYTYYVKAISGATAATASNVITVKVAAPDAPTGLANTSVTRILVIDQVGLSWTQPGTAPASSTQVQWATNVGFTTGVGSQTINGSGTSGTVTVGRGLGGTPNPANLYFRVRSINPVGNSVYSTAIGPIAMK
jgi:FtsP/CotA-like multicopper oxidase with cupredoxin domain/fibronectin type 3 domain-containing protein